MSTMILLGAGASVEAGLPTTEGLTSLVERRVSELATNPDVLRAFRYALGGLTFRQGERGLPVQQVNIEDVISALDLLGHRGSLQVAPFVGSWHHMVEKIDPAGGGKPFLEAAREARWAVADLLRVEDSTPVDYLAPILDLARTQPKLVIATLNYDETVELLFKRGNTELSTGMDSFTLKNNNPRVEFRGNVWLIKLHGSVSWRFHRGLRPEGGRITAPWVFSCEPTAGRAPYHDPCLLLGSTEKLQSEGPFLQHLQVFETELNASDQLVVVGYSCRDEHINTSLFRWHNSTPPGERRNLTFVDPNFGAVGEQPSFVERRARIVAEGAGAGLRTVLGPESPLPTAQVPGQLVTRSRRKE